MIGVLKYYVYYIDDTVINSKQYVQIEYCHNMLLTIIWNLLYNYKYSENYV